MIGQYQFIGVEHVEQCSKVPLPCPKSVELIYFVKICMEIHKTTPNDVLLKKLNALMIAISFTATILD